MEGISKVTGHILCVCECMCVCVNASVYVCVRNGAGRGVLPGFLSREIARMAKQSREKRVNQVSLLNTLETHDRTASAQKQNLCLST